MTDRKRRNRERKMTRNIAGEECICPELAAELLGCCRSTLDGMVARSKAGNLKPALMWYRDTPRSPIWFSKAFLKQWAQKRREMHV